MESFKHRKLVSILISIFLVLGISACNQPAEDSTLESNQEQSSQTESLTQEEVDPFGKYNPIVEVTATRMINDGLKFVDGETLENNKWTKHLYEDTLGVKVKYLWTAPESQYDQKMAVSIASDDLPDFMRVNIRQLRLLADSNKLMDMSEIYKKYASESVKKCYEGDEGLSLNLGVINGELLGLSQPASPLDSVSMVWIRYDWMEKMNIAEPENMDDLIAIMDAFTNLDPNENNIKDTIGMGLEKNFGGFAGLEGFYNGYQAYPNSWLKDGNGELVYGGIQTEVRNALLKLQELYKNGVIDKEFAVKDAAKVAEDTTGGKIGLIFGQMWNPLWPLQDSVNNDSNADWRPYPIVSSTEKDAVTSVSMGTETMQFLAVNKKSEHPEIAVKLINVQAEQWLGLFYGNDSNKDTHPQEIRDYYLNNDITQAWQYQLFEIAPANKNLTQHLKAVEIADGNAPENGALTDIVTAINEFEDNGNKEYWGMSLVFGRKGSFNMINNDYNIPKRYVTNEFYGAPTQTMIEKGATLEKMQLETFTKIIMGDPIENFDKYVENWKKLGGEDITKEVNEWYEMQK